MNQLAYNRRLIGLLIALAVILIPAQAYASQTNGFDQIHYQQFQIADRKPADPNAKVSVGISADKKNIYAGIDMGPWYREYPWPMNYTYGFNFRKGYSLTIGNQVINFEIQGAVGYNLAIQVVEAKTGWVIGSGTMFKTTNDTSWQITIPISGLKKYIGSSMPENTQIGLKNASLYQGVATMTYSGAPTGPWLLVGIGFLFALGGYFWQHRRKIKPVTIAMTEVSHA